MQYSTAMRNAGLDAKFNVIGASAILKIFAGVMPANPSLADAGTVIVTLNLPAVWMNPAVNGSKAKAGTWQDLSADAPGTAAYFRIYDSTGATCHIQGTCALSNADMLIDGLDFTAGQTFTVTAFSVADNNG